MSTQYRENTQLWLYQWSNLMGSHLSGILVAYNAPTKRLIFSSPRNDLMPTVPSDLLVNVRVNHVCKSGENKLARSKQYVRSRLLREAGFVELLKQG